MKDPRNIIDRLSEDGHRITKARRAIVEKLISASNPISAADIHSLLAQIDINVNITTIYREIEFLKQKDIIREIQIGDGKKRYELWPDKHHHHLVCVSCESIECVELNRCLESEEELILKKNGFKTIRHSLEFHGICGRCGG